MAAPWAWAHGHTAVASALYYLFLPLCHERPDRSFAWMGHRLAVCNRCTGIYLGALLGILAFPFFVSLTNGVLTPDARAKTPRRIFLFAALALVALDVGLDWLGLRSNTPVSRFLTGGICGIVAAFYLLPPLFEIFAVPMKRSHAAAMLETPEPRGF